MNQSERLNLNLPSINDEANINAITQNFQTIDDQVALSADIPKELENNSIVRAYYASNKPSGDEKKGFLSAFSYGDLTTGYDLYNAETLERPLSLAAGQEYDKTSPRATSNKALDNYLKDSYYDKTFIDEIVQNITNKVLANTLRGKKSGKFAKMADISPLEHPLNVSQAFRIFRT